jgi:cytochrome c
MRAWVGAFVVAVLGAASLGSAAPEQAGAPAVRVLVFSKTAAFRHASIPAAVTAIQRLGAENGFAVDATEDAGVFTDAGLARYRAVVFALTTGDVLDPAQQAALQRYMARGGGFAGIHSASDTEHAWPWYGGLVGAYFREHPAVQPAVIDVVDRTDPSTLRLPRRWPRTDEWYAFTTSPSGKVHVLATLDESTYSPGSASMGGDHPIAWSHRYGGGRAWYTALGHTEESWSEPLFLGHVLGGILWAAGVDPPRVTSLAATVRGRSVTVVARHGPCPRCRATLVARGRRTAMRIDATTARATVRLPAGRSAIAVVLQDRSTGFATTARRLVRVR